MKWIQIILIAALLAGCAHLPGGDRQAGQRTDLWTEAHLALHAEDFRHARATFQRLADDFPATDEGREALFYLGAVSLDPRNPDWNAVAAVATLRQYLSADTARAVIQRRPEATTLLRLAEQAGAPAPEPTAGAPATPPPTPATTPQPTRLVPAEQLRQAHAENEQLRRQILERDETIRRQREELDRIRRILAPRTP